jgi:WD40 repeat protein
VPWLPPASATDHQEEVVAVVPEVRIGVFALLAGPVVLATGCSDESTPAATPATTHSAASTIASSGPGKTPTVPGLAGRLVFAKAGGAYEDGTFFLMNADGTDEQAIDGADHTCCGRVSHDGSMLLVAGLTEDDRVTIAIVPIDGGTPRLLPLPGGTLNLGPGAWSPDDKRIAVQGWDDTDHSKDGLYLVDSDNGGHRVRLTRAPEGHAHLPGDFSPDGRWLVYGNENAVTTPSQGNLEIIDLHQGGPPRRLTSTDDIGLGATRFSPDGRQILFADGRLSPRGALWTIRPDGTHLSKVWDDGTTFGSNPAWSPDGTQIVFSVNPIADDYEHRPNALAAINADGSNYREIVRDDDFRRENTWIP